MWYTTISCPGFVAYTTHHTIVVCYGNNNETANFMITIQNTNTMKKMYLQYYEICCRKDRYERIC